MGNCELFDKEGGVELRHREEVRAAEEEARKKVQEEHKDLDPQLLEFEDSEKLKWDAAPRKQERESSYSWDYEVTLHVLYAKLADNF